MIVTYLITRRKQLKINQESMAAAIGVSLRTYKRIESRESDLSVNELEKALVTLKVNMVMVPGEGVINFGS